MAVQIPELDRNDPVAPVTGLRIDTNVAQTAQADAEKGAAIQGVTTETVKLGKAIQEHAWDTEATKQTNAYDKQYREGLYGKDGGVGVAQQEGDPTVAFNNFDQQNKSYIDNVLSNPNYSDGMKAAVYRKLIARDQVLNDKKLTIYGTRNATYINNVSEDAATTEKKSTVDAAAMVNADDPDSAESRASLQPIDASLQRLEQNRIAQGIKMHTVVPDANGTATFIDPVTGKPAVDDKGNLVKYKLGPQAAFLIAKDKSDALYNATTNLLNSGQVDEAKMVMDNYDQYLDEVHKPKLEKEYQEANLKQKSNQLAIDAEGVPPEKATDHIIDNAETPEIESKALEIYANNQRHVQDNIDRLNKNTFNTMALRVQSQQQSGKVLSITDLENDPIYLNQKSNMDAKQIEALHEMIDSPKTSDPKAKANVMQLAVNGNLTGMSYPDLAQNMKGLNKEDRSKIETKWSSDNAPDGVEAKAQFSFMGKELEKQMFAAHLINHNSFGKYPDADQRKLIQAQNDLMDAVAHFPPKMSVADQGIYVRKFVADRVQGQLFTGVNNTDGTPAKFQSAPQPKASTTPTPTSAATPPPKATSTPRPAMSDEDTINALKAFQKANGRPWSKTDGPLKPVGK